MKHIRQEYSRAVSLLLFMLLACAPAIFAQTTPQTSGEYLAEGNKFYRENQWNKAIEHYTESIKMREENATAFLMRGAAYFNMKELDKAVADFTQAIALDPWEYLAYYRRGEGYEKQGKKELAAADKREFASRIQQKAKPGNAQEFYEFADYFADRGFYSDGIVYYGEAIKLDPHSKNGFPPVTAFEKRAELYALANKFEEALKDYASALAETGTTRPQINLKRANLYSDLFFWKGAMNFMDNAIADYSVLISNHRKNFVSDEDVLNALANRALHYEGKREYDKAIADYT